MGEYTGNMRGFSTIEMLIAFAVMTLGLSAVMLVSFGNQSMTIDTELANRALYIAERELELARASAVEDFASLASLFTAKAAGEMYDKEVKITDISECVKRAESIVRWQTGSKFQETSLSTIVSDPEASLALGHECDTEELEEEWDNPTSFTISDPIAAGSSGTDLDVLEYDGKTYVFLTSEWSNNKDTLWVLDVTDPEDPEIVGGYEASDGKDFNAVDAYLDETTGLAYAFVASASTTAQLQVLAMDFTKPEPVAVSFVTKRQLPGVAGSAPEGLEMYYRAGRVYVGTHRTLGHEFHIYDVTTPAVPAHLGSKELNHNVNDLMVVGDWAYLATSDNSGEIIALDVANPASIPNFDTTKFDAPGHTDSDGTSIFVTGQYAYLGRVRDKNEADFFVVRTSDIRDTASITDGLVGSVDMDDNLCTDEDTGNTRACLGPNTAIEGIAVRGKLAFFVTTQQTAEFQVWNMQNPANPVPQFGCNAYEFPAKPVSIDFFGGLGYVAVDSNDAIRIIHDQVGSCAL